MRIVLYIAFATLFVGCASTPPRNTRNACHILYEKSEWTRPLRKAANKWNIPKHTILSIINHESSFIPDARPPRRKVLGMSFIGRRISSAYGYPQALDGTWADYLRGTGNWSAKRTNFEDAADFVGWYLNRSVKRLGISRRNAYHLYLAYHQGDGGFKRKSYASKPAIKRYARKVQSTAVAYRNQIRSCSRYL